MLDLRFRDGDNDSGDMDRASLSGDGDRDFTFEDGDQALVSPGDGEHSIFVCGVFSFSFGR